MQIFLQTPQRLFLSFTLGAISTEFHAWKHLETYETSHINIPNPRRSKGEVKTLPFAPCFPVGTSCKPTHPTRYDGWLWGSAGVSVPKNYDHPTDPSQSPSLISQIIDQHSTSPTSIDSARGSEDDSVLQSLAILKVTLSLAGYDPMIFPLNWLKPCIFDG